MERPILEPQARVKDVPEGVAGEVEAEHGEGDRAGRGEPGPGWSTMTGYASFSMMPQDGPPSAACPGR